MCEENDGKHQMITLRQYQEEGVGAVIADLHDNLNVLLEAPTGAGKTVIFSAIIKRLLEENPGFRIAVIMDRHLLVTQTEEKLRSVAPELMLDIGLCCASISPYKDIDKRIVIASRQSLIGQMNRMAPVNLCIVDECHLMSMPGSKGYPDQFGDIISKLREYHPGMRLLGCTATPYRLSEGYIYGNRHAPDLFPYWDKLNHKIRIETLQSQGFLSKLVGHTSVTSALASELDSLPLIGGEYNMTYLSDTMVRHIHLQSAVDIWKQYASGRKKTIVFCVTTGHSDKMAEAFNDSGVPAISIHSGLTDIEHSIAMKSIKGDSEHKVFCSVGQLTTGFDEPSIDAIILARPTKSASLYKQMLGRGMRTHYGKEDCMILDICGLNNTFGTDLDNVRIDYRKAVDKDGNELVDGKNKECPKCQALLHPAVRICLECEYVFPVPEKQEATTPEMKEAQYGSAPELPPVKMQVVAMYPKIHTSKKTEKKLLQVRMEMESDAGRVTASLWLCFEGDGYVGFAVQKGAALWRKLSHNHDEPYPHTAELAMSAIDIFYELKKDLLFTPDWCMVRRDGKFWNIVDFGYDKRGEAWEGDLPAMSAIADADERMPF